MSSMIKVKNPRNFDNKVSVTFDFFPEEHQTLEHPGIPAEIDILKVIDHNGELLDCTEIELKKIEEQLWDEYAHQNELGHE